MYLFISRWFIKLLHLRDDLPSDRTSKDQHLKDGADTVETDIGKESGDILLRKAYIRKQAVGLFFHHSVALAGPRLETRAIDYGYAAPPVVD
jgi:hypothetical protein